MRRKKTSKKTEYTDINKVPLDKFYYSQKCYDLFWEVQNECYDDYLGSIKLFRKRIDDVFIHFPVNVNLSRGRIISLIYIPIAIVIFLLPLLISIIVTDLEQWHIFTLQIIAATLATGLFHLYYIIDSFFNNKKTAVGIDGSKLYLKAKEKTKIYKLTDLKDISIQKRGYWNYYKLIFNEGEVFVFEGSLIGDIIKHTTPFHV